MNTHSTVPAVKSKLVTLIKGALATASVTGGQIPTTYAWPGSSAQPECVFLGPHPALEDIKLDVRESDPSIKAGRRMRQEAYDVTVTVWSFRPDLTPDDAEVAESRAFEIAGYIEDLIADDAQIGLAGVVQTVLIAGLESALHPFESGWACALTITLSVAARLL